MRSAPFIAFFVSGASSLIFQSIWSRLLHHVFGSSSVAISSVVSVFMGGLALGAFLFGRYADRIRRPLLVYAVAELGIALFALGVPALVQPEGWLSAVNAALRYRFGSESLEFMVMRFLCIVPVLLVPTTLMGATLPLLSRHFVDRREHAEQVGVRVGALYAINTLGAVVGVFLAGFVLMPRLGVSATNAVAVGMNLALAAGIFALWALTKGGVSRRGAEHANPGESDRQDAHPEGELAPAARRVATLAFALSGFCSLLYEVVWSRALVNTIGGSVYAFALILMTFLTGIAGGSALASALVDQGRRALPPLSWAAVVMCLLVPLPLGVRVGPAAWVAASAACLALLGLCAAGLRRSAERRALLEDQPPGDELERRAGLALVALPLLAAAAVAAVLGGRLPWLVLSALCSAAVLLLALVWMRRDLLRQLAAVQAFIALSTLVSDVWADEISLTFASMVAPLYHSLADHVDRVMATMFTTAALCVLPSALGMGAMFPLTMRAFSGGGARVGRDVSVVYAGNTLGSIAGAWLPGFVLMPMLGMQATLHVGIAINLVLAAAVLLAGAPRRALAAATLPALAACLVLLHLASAPRSPLAWNLSKMTLGVFRISLAKDVLDEETWGEPDLLYYEDGLSTTVSVERWGRHLSLKNNGKVEASNGDDMPTQIMVTALPLLLHQKGARGLDVAIIGLGSGVTVGAALQFPVRSVEVMELERAVAEASRFFAPVNHLEYPLERYPHLRMPRLTLINDDGRNYLASTHRRYDVIVGEPSNPWLTGVADLFTADHFRIAKRKLRPGGVYCEWVQLYEMSPVNVKIIYRTFASQFRHVVVFSAEDLSSDTILVGSDAPLEFDLAHLRRGLAEPGVAAELERAYVHSPLDLLARVLLADRREVMQYTQLEERREGGRWRALPASTNHAPCPPASCRRTPAPINTDDNALIEFAAPRDLIGFERYKGYLQTIYADAWPYGRLSALVRGEGSGAHASEQFAELSLALLAHGRKREASAALDRAAAHGPSAALALARGVYEALGTRPREPALRLSPPAADPAVSARANQRIAHAHAEVVDWLSRGQPKRAKAVLDALPASLVRHAGAPMRYLRAYVLQRTGDHDLAIGDLEALARTAPGFVHERPELYYFLGRSHYALLHFDKAVRALRAYVETARHAQAADAEVLPEPAPANAPSSDAPGQSDKRFQPHVTPG
jgi:predicted membrane-bound spermidine synthase/tetratricopeptide (TPR) repeat protein